MQDLDKTDYDYFHGESTNEEYKVKRLGRFREVISFSFLFLTFFDGKLHFTKEFYGFVILRQEKIKEKRLLFDEWYYQEYWTPWSYSWETIKIY